ncbi:hypothetical protein Tsubulata_051127 [Turnera subulata]|uniref:Uncharacterized protein n=1 Tax=Turnera subulata TaxID=218843 RepID=A0A9Q0J1W1_9ROSI|nr:hypothetical protein Tsubulata_051127 [Turnera subulata]
MYDQYQAQFSQSKGFGPVKPVKDMPVWIQHHLIHTINAADKFYKPRVERISRSACEYANKRQKARDLFDTSEDVKGKIKTYNARALVRDYHSHLRIRMQYVDPAPLEQLQLANEHLLPQDG